MKTNKLISLILTAALALSACASAANSATAAAPAETAAATPEPTAAPEPVGELHALAETGQNKFGNVIVRPVPPLTMRATLLEPSFTKQTLTPDRQPRSTNTTIARIVRYTNF